MDEAPRFRKGTTVVGTRLTFREATAADAAFVLQLRINPVLNEFLSSTANDLDAQAAWIKSAAEDPSQLYYIISAGNEPVGTVRLYDQRGESFCWGSWILSADAPKSGAIESTMMVYSLGLALGFTAAHFDVRRGNEKVWQYHERLGAKRIDENGLDFVYSIDHREIISFLARYEGRSSVKVVVPSNDEQPLPVSDPAQRT